MELPADRKQYFFCEETQQWHDPENVTLEWPVLLQKTQQIVTSDVVVASSSLIALLSLAVLINPTLLPFVRKKNILAFVKNRHQEAAYQSSSSAASRFTEKAKVKVPKIRAFPKGLCNRKFKQFLNRLIFADFFKYSCDKFNGPRVSAKFMPLPYPGIRSGALQPVLPKIMISTITGVPIFIVKRTKEIGGRSVVKLADLFLIWGGCQVLDENLKIVDIPKKSWTLKEKVFLGIIVLLLLKLLILELWLWDKDLTIVDKDVAIAHLYYIMNQLLRDLHKLWFKVKNC